MDKIAIIGSGHISFHVANRIKENTSKEVVIIDDVFSNNSVVLRPFHISEMLYNGTPMSGREKRRDKRKKDRKNGNARLY